MEYMGVWRGVNEWFVWVEFCFVVDIRCFLLILWWVNVLVVCSGCIGWVVNGWCKRIFFVCVCFLLMY